MRTYECEQLGKAVVIHMSKGEDILRSITEECARLGVKNAMVVGAIGSLRKVSYHRIESLADDPVNTYVTLEKPTELSALQGLILDGEPHLHITCCDPQHAYGGHMELGCEVQYLAEVSLVELKGADLTRRLDEFGISYIDKR